MDATSAGKRIQMRVGILHPVSEAAEFALVNPPPEAAVDLIFGLNIDRTAAKFGGAAAGDDRGIADAQMRRADVKIFWLLRFLARIRVYVEHWRGMPSDAQKGSRFLNRSKLAIRPDGDVRQLA